MKYLVLAFTLCSACASFEDEDIVIDMRVIAMSADVPDQLVEIDLENPPEPAELLGQLVPSEMCALVADPTADRRLRWSMTLCVLTNDERCDADLPSLKLASGIAEDPDIALPIPRLCATVEPDGNLLGVLLAALEHDSLGGLGGLDYGISFTVGGEGDDPELDLYAGKTLRVTPRIPETRTANTNPSVDHFEAMVNGAEAVPLPLGRCVDQAAPLVVGPGDEVRITPVETEGTREMYVIPTFDGDAQTFTESPTYQWLTAAGDLTRGSSGGTRDAFGNPAELFTEWRAPAARNVTTAITVPLWIVQRDERLGARWYEACLRVEP